VKLSDSAALWSKESGSACAQTNETLNTSKGRETAMPKLNFERTGKGKERTLGVLLPEVTLLRSSSSPLEFLWINSETPKSDNRISPLPLRACEFCMQASEQ
jgi:hypothetical protein